MPTLTRLTCQHCGYITGFTVRGSWQCPECDRDNPSKRKPQLYSLFERPRQAPKGTRWTRVEGAPALPQQAAIRFFQNALLNAFFSGGPTRALRPVKEDR